MEHANVFTLTRPVVCLNKATQKLFLKTGSLIFSTTYEDELGNNVGNVYSIKSIDEKGDVQNVIDDYCNNYQPIYIGFPGETVSPFSKGFVETVRELGTQEDDILDLINKLEAYHIKVDKDETIDVLEISFSFITVGDLLYIETCSWNDLKPYGVPYELNDHVETVNGYDIYDEFLYTLENFYTVFNKPKSIVLKHVFIGNCNPKYKEKIKQTVRELCESIDDSRYLDIKFELDEDVKSKLENNSDYE